MSSQQQLIHPSYRSAFSQGNRIGQLVVSLRLQALTVLLAALALITMAVVEADGQFSPPLVIRVVLQFATLLLGAFGIRFYAQSHLHVPTVTPLIILIATLVMLWEPVSRALLGSGRPLEIMLMHAYSSSVWGLGLASVWQRYQNPSVLMSLFLAVFSLSATHQNTTIGLVAIITVLVIFWLSTRYWEQLTQRLQGQVLDKKRRLFLPGLSIALVLLLLLGTEGRTSMSSISGFLSSSGGDKDASPYARHGVGSGEMLVAGSENIQSFGPIEDAPYMTDDRPSLYDVFDDTYNEPATVKKIDRSIALTSDKVLQPKEHLHTQTERASREFSTLRESKPQKRNDTRSLKSNALFYVSGRVPLHLRLELYDTFDGVSWHAEPLPTEWEQPAMNMARNSEKDWLQLIDRSNTWTFLGPPETHALKIVNLDTSTIPAPLHLHGIHIADVTQLDMYKPGPQGLIQLDRKQLPELVPIHLASRSTNSEEIKLSKHPNNSGQYTQIPDTLLPELQKLADKWKGTSPDAWQQITSIVNHLRTHYQHDRTYHESPDSESPLLSFLEESHTGPDYQFATSAALLIRSLGYPTRVVSGFYASPEKYDYFSRHTPVTKEDVHFWAEVCLANGAWITLEPTPGYQVLQPPLGLLGHLRSFAASALTFVREYWLLITFISLVLVILIRYRLIIADIYSTCCWRVFPNRRTSPWAWKILLRRIKASGWIPPEGITPQSILGHIAGGNFIDSTLCFKFTKKLDSEVFGRQPPDNLIAHQNHDSMEPSNQILKILKRSTCQKHFSNFKQPCH